MANEAVSVGETGDGSGGGGAPVKLEPMVDLGKVVFKGEKFFWRYAHCWMQFGVAASRCCCCRHFSERFRE